MYPALVALLLGSFAIGTTEFVVAGLLPAIADDLGVSIPDAGCLVTGYALSVAVGGPLLVLVAAVAGASPRSLRVVSNTSSSCCWTPFVLLLEQLARDLDVRVPGGLVDVVVLEELRGRQHDVRHPRSTRS